LQLTGLLVHGVRLEIFFAGLRVNHLPLSQILDSAIPSVAYKPAPDVLQSSIRLLHSIPQNPHLCSRSAQLSPTLSLFKMCLPIEISIFIKVN
jgi:hypothetical protein